MRPPGAPGWRTNSFSRPVGGFVLNLQKALSGKSVESPAYTRTCGERLSRKRKSTEYTWSGFLMCFGTILGEVTVLWGLVLALLGSISGVDSFAAFAMARSSNLESARPGATPLEMPREEAVAEKVVVLPPSLETCKMDGSP